MWNRLSAILGGEKDSPQGKAEDVNIKSDLIPGKEEFGVTPSDVKIAQDQIRILEVEREVLRETIRHLYEAEADEKLSGRELQKVVGRYKERLTQIENTIQHDRSVVALYDLERIQTDMLELFNRHFNDLNKKIGELRTRLDRQPASTPPVKEEEPQQTPQKRVKPKKETEKAQESTVPEEREADKRVEKIRAEIEKTLERLDQIEIEA